MAFIKKQVQEAKQLLDALVPAQTGAKASAVTPTKPTTAYVGSYTAGPSTVRRDFDAEARGKTRCALEEAWAQSPLLPMLVKDPNDRAELHAILDEIVTERMKRVFPNG